MKMFCHAHLHRKFDPLLYKEVESQEPALVRNLATPQARKLYRLNRQVIGLIHLKKGFMRFNVSHHKILYTKTELEHDVVDHLLEHFHERYPAFIIAIEIKDKTHTIDQSGCIKTHKKKAEDIVKMLEISIKKDKTIVPQDNKALWQEYYDSQYISQRRNLKLMKQMIPLKYRDDNNIETNISKRCRKLEEFM